MISRYSDEKIATIWSLENKFSKMLDIEILVLEALASIGQIPSDVPSRVKQKARFTVEEIQREEKKTRHDVVAFVNVVSRYIGEDAQYFHKGLTSSDVLDTTFVLLNLESIEYVITLWRQLMDVLYKLSLDYKYLPQIGRTHGIHAEPMTLGLRFLNYHFEAKRVLSFLEYVKSSISYMKLSGAVGTYANLPPYVEEYVADKLGLKRFVPATQIISRDVFVDPVYGMAKLMSALKRWAINFRLMNLTEILEIQEAFYKNQAGSSAMPHKKNPISWERITGLARVVESYVGIALQNNALWFERDISHSSTERIIFPDMYHIAAYSISLMTRLLKDIRINKSHIDRNLNLLRGLIFTGRLLVVLMDKGYPRTEAYQIVYDLAMLVWENESLHLKDVVKERLKEVLSPQEIEEVFNLDYYLRHVDFIFDIYEQTS